LTAGGGAGLQAGVSVPTWRAFATATFADAFVRRPTPAPVVDEPPPREPAKVLAEEIPGVTDVPPPPPPPVVKADGDALTFREEITFAPGSDELCPESRAIVAAVADLLARDGRIAHLAIEGHADDPGDLPYDWELSDRRARAVWEALIVEGVVPQRMSWRGVGKVPLAKDATPDRRVVMLVPRWLAQGENPPPTPDSLLLPWNGQPTTPDAVSIPEFTAPAPKTDTVDRTFFDEDDDP
jgi:outer membrane protein OmpA-like peptidoglycan-associated protein